MTDTATPPRSAVRYSTVAIILHWLIAALLIFQVALGLRMEAAHGSAKFVVFQLHKSIGITILLLVALRLLWRLWRKPPAIVAKPWERTLAHVVHGLFYVLLFALPISGWVIISTSRIVVPTLLYGMIPWPHFPGLAGLAGAAKEAWHGVGEFAHVNLVYVLYGLFALHVAGALKHHFIDRDGNIARMAPGTKPGAIADPRLLLIGFGVLLAAGLGLRWLPLAPAKPVVLPVTAEAPAAPAAHDAPPPAAAPVPPVTVAPPPAEDVAGNAAEAEKPSLSAWAIAKSSTLRFHTTWSGDAIDGGFSQFAGDIAFSPDLLDRSHVEIRVKTGSAYSGDAQRDETLKSADWFSVDAFGTAIFRAEKFRKAGANRFIASGTLKLKGVTLPVSLPFTLDITGDKAKMRGTATVDRTAYKIGEGDYASTNEIPAAVKVDVAIDATRK